MQIVFDIGTYDGADTAYLLQSGCRIVAVEANSGTGATRHPEVRH